MIPGVPSVGGMELLVVLAIILLFFGAKRVPELARSLGRGKREFSRGIEEAEVEERDTVAEAHGESREKEEVSPPREKAHLGEAGEASTLREAENSRVEQSPQKH